MLLLSENTHRQKEIGKALQATMFSKRPTLAAFIAFTVVVSSVEAQDQRAQEACRLIHHQDVEPHDTAYSNAGCLLTCNVHGAVEPHFLNQSQPCPDDHSGVSSHSFVPIT